MTGDTQIPMPDELRFRAVRAEEVPEQRVRFRPESWERALAFVPEACALLRDPFLTEEAEGYNGDRSTSRRVLEAYLASADLTCRSTVLASFTLVVAWGAGTTNTRSLRYTPIALVDPRRAAEQLSRAVEALRRDDIVDAYDGFTVPGIGQSFATRWFALAGRRRGREWQPLILDMRVRSALDAFGLSLYVLAGGRRSRAGGYEAYVRTLHRWAAEVRPENPACSGETLEWLLSEHGRDGWADR
jgi:hypothetical protein